MNPLFQAALGSIIRTALAIGAGWFVRKGIWTDGEATSYVAAASLGVIALGWSLFQKYWSRLDFLAALMSDPGSTGEQAKALARAPAGPDATTPDDVKVHATTASRSFMGKIPVVLLAALLGGSVALSGCAKGVGASPERKVAGYGQQVADGIKAGQALAKDLNAGGLLPDAQYKQALQVLVKVNEAGERVGDALLAYDAATSATDASNAAAQIDAALVTLGTLLPEVFSGVSNPEARDRIQKVVGEVQKLIVTIARFTAPRAAALSVQGELAWAS